KNKTAPPFRECDIHLYYWPQENLWGFSKAADMYHTAIRMNLINSSGTKKTYDKTISLGLGELNSILEIHNDPDKFRKIREDLKRRLGYKDFVFNKELVGKLFVVPDN